MNVDSSFLEKAVLRAGGTSGGAVKNAIIKILDRIAVPSVTIVDVGAGKGELLKSLDMTKYSALAGVDYLNRPEDLNIAISWHQMNLNTPVPIEATYDIVVCSETIEHLENPRHTMRYLASIANEDGHIIITMPNQESLRSYGSLLSYRHFVQFRDECYPAHITVNRPGFAGGSNS